MQAIKQLRALARYQTHGGYTWAMVADDGQMICIPCVRANYRLILHATHTATPNGWQCVGMANDGETDDSDDCAHCNKNLWSK